MAIYILNLNERSKKAKALLQLIKEMASTEKSINIDANEGLGKPQHYEKSFVKKINKSRQQLKNGETETLITADLWK